MCPHAGQRAHGPHWAGKPASILSILQAQAPHPVPAKVNSPISSELVASAECIAILIVDAETAKQEQITGSDSSDAGSFSSVAVFNSINEMNEFSLQDKLLLRLILNLFRVPCYKHSNLLLGQRFAKYALVFKIVNRMISTTMTTRYHHNE